MKTRSSMTWPLLAGAVFVALAASPLARADYESTVLSQEPAGYWRLNETIQPQIIAGAANLGSLGSTAIGTYNSYPIRGLTGPFAGSVAVGLDGGAQYVSTAWQAGLTGNSFSYELWVKPAAVPYFGYVASSGQMNSPRTGWYLAQDDGTVFGYGPDVYVFRTFIGSGTTPGVTVYAPVNPEGTWLHLVLTYDASTSTASIYTNGVLAMSATGNHVANADSPTTIGCRSSLNFFWPGEAAEAAMYTSALSASQVLNHYTTATTTPANYQTTVLADAPVAYYRFQEPIDPPAANLGTLGSAANGLYIYNAKAGVTGPITPTFPGFGAANKAAAFDAGGGVVRIPALNLNTNTVTISCWINATNAQPIGAGLVLAGSGANASGLTIDQINGGLGLGYIWNGENYGISPAADFGLPTLPDSQWAYAALVIEPAQAAIYICDANNYANFTSITNSFNVNHLPQTFGSATLVGAAAGYNNRNFNGAIDEVAIFERALSAGELYSQYATAVGGVPPRIFSDLQGPTEPVAVGDPIILVVDAGGTPPLTYTWRRDGGTIATTTNGVLTIASASLGDNGTYDVTISSTFGNAPSQPVGVTVVTPTQPTITGAQGFIDRTLYPTGTLSLAVSATGGGLKYQWYKNTTPIPSATGSSYTIANVTAADAGSYSVSITNSVGDASNGPVAITIASVAPGSYEATIVASGPQAWWRLDETSGSTIMFDAVGRHDGTYTNASGSGPLPILGVTGALVTNNNTAVSFSPGDQAIGLVPYSADLNPVKFTVEAWVKTTVTDGSIVPVSSTFGSGGWWWQTTAGTWAGFGPSGFAPIYDEGNTEALIASGLWTHLVICYDGTRSISGTLYPYTYFVNGVTDGFVWTGSSANTSGPFIIGARGVSAATLADRFFDGQVDEVAVYQRVLPSTEIQAHIAARGVVLIAPSFAGEFLSQTVTVGKPVSFSTTVQGTAPVSLQWYKNGAPISDATNASLTIASAALTDAGTYTLRAENGVGTNSQSATLAVVPPPGYANVTNGLVLHLRFDGDTTDSSGRGNDGTPAGAAAPAFVTGIIGSQAVELTTEASGGSVSSASYVTLGAVASGPPADLRFGSSTSFSVSLWVKVTSNAVPGDLPFIGTETNAANNPGWFLGPGYQTGGWQWNLNDGGANNLGVSGPDNSINDGEWHNFVLVVDRAAAVANAYLDGVLVSSKSISSLGSLDNNNYWPVAIGQDPTGSYPEAGSATLDDIGIWRRALTSLEVANIASAGSTGGRSFDTVGPIPLAITPSASGLVLNYAAGTLLQSSTLGAGAVWETVPGASPPSYAVTPSGDAKYYRVLVQ